MCVQVRAVIRLKGHNHPSAPAFRAPPLNFDEKITFLIAQSSSLPFHGDPPNAALAETGLGSARPAAITPSNNLAVHGPTASAKDAARR
jgi:hypothetical protein